MICMFVSHITVQFLLLAVLAACLLLLQYEAFTEIILEERIKRKLARQIGRTCLETTT